MFAGSHLYLSDGLRMGLVYIQLQATRNAYYSGRSPSLLAEGQLFIYLQAELFT